MSVRLKQRAGMLLVAGAALLAAALAVLPGVAEAQDMAAVPTTTVESTNVGAANASADATTPVRLPDGSTPVDDDRSATDVSGVVTPQAVNSPPSVGEAVSSRPDAGLDPQAGWVSNPLQPGLEPATRLVVNPGDSLWSISQGRLHPDASPGQVLSDVERIFEFNRDRIGDVPGLILPGQELLLPPPVTEPAVAALAVSEPTPASVSEPPVALPDLPTVEAVPQASVESYPEPYYAFPRRLLGLGIMVLSLVVAILMVWKLPMKRDVFVGRRRLDELPRPSPNQRTNTGVLSDEPSKAKTPQLRAVDGNLDSTGLESPKDSRKEVNSDAV